MATACDTLAQLRAAEISLVTGSKETKVRYRSDTGSEQEIQYGRGDIAALRQLIARYEDLCAVELGRSGQRRRCFTGGL